jgi:hypothetical protein
MLPDHQHLAISGDFWLSEFWRVVLSFGWDEVQLLLNILQMHRMASYNNLLSASANDNETTQAWRKSHEPDKVMNRTNGTRELGGSSRQMKSQQRKSLS